MRRCRRSSSSATTCCQRSMPICSVRLVDDLQRWNCSGRSGRWQLFACRALINASTAPIIGDTHCRRDCSRRQTSCCAPVLAADPATGQRGMSRARTSAFSASGGTPLSSSGRHHLCAQQVQLALEVLDLGEREQADAHEVIGIEIGIQNQVGGIADMGIELSHLMGSGCIDCGAVPGAGGLAWPSMLPGSSEGLQAFGRVQHPAPGVDQREQPPPGTDPRACCWTRSCGVMSSSASR